MCGWTCTCRINRRHSVITRSWFGRRGIRRRSRRRSARRSWPRIRARYRPRPDARHHRRRRDRALALRHAAVPGAVGRRVCAGADRSVRRDCLLRGAAPPRDGDPPRARRAARQVRGLILREGAALIAAGLAIGSTGTFAATRMLASVLFGVSPLDPPTIGGAAIFVVP